MPDFSMRVSNSILRIFTKNKRIFLLNIRMFLLNIRIFNKSVRTSVVITVGKITKIVKFKKKIEELFLVHLVQFFRS